MSAPALALLPGSLPLERSWEDMLLEAVLPEFQVEVYHAKPGDPVLHGPTCAVGGCAGRGVNRSLGLNANGENRSTGKVGGRLADIVLIEGVVGDGDLSAEHRVKGRGGRASLDPGDRRQRLLMALELAEQRLDRRDSIGISASAQPSQHPGELAREGSVVLSSPASDARILGNARSRVSQRISSRPARRPRAAARSQPTHTAPRSVIAAIRLRCARCEQRGVGPGGQRRQTDGPWWLL